MKNKKMIAIVSMVIVLLIVGVVFFFTTGSKSYTVSFNTNGGSTIKSQEVKEDDIVIIPTNPSREGYEFIGWYLDGKKFDFKTKITEDVTLEAKWKMKKEDNDTENDKTYTVTFDTGSKTSKVTVEDGKTVSKPSTPTKDGYKFIEWQLNGKAYDFSKEVSKDITLVAKWEKVNTNDEKNTSGNTKPSGSQQTTAPSTNTPTEDTKPSTSENTKPSASEDKKPSTSENTKPVNSEDKKPSASEDKKPSTSGSTKPSTVKVTGISVSSSSVSLKVGGTSTITATVNPNNATNKSVVWSSSNNGVATVSNGNITAVGVGTATITVKTVDGNKTATINVNVTDSYNCSISLIDDYTPSRKVKVTKNGTDVTSSIQYIYNASGTFLGSYDGNYGAIIIDQSDANGSLAVKVNGQLINCK